MTGRDLIIYIMENELENEDLFADGKIAGYITAEEAASKFGVGASTISVWINQDKIKGLRINDKLYVPFNVQDPRKTEDEFFNFKTAKIINKEIRTNEQINK